jgi:hypothetical protein
MTEQHPDSRLLERFMRNELQGQERRIVVRHLLTGCPRCVSVTRQIWSLADRRPGALPALSGRERRLDRAPGEGANAAAALGRSEPAESALLDAWQGSVEQGRGTEAAAAVLELALLYKRQGRSSDLRRIAGEELRPIFLARDIPNHAAAALLVFRRIVETEHANERFLFEIARFLAGPPALPPSTPAPGPIVDSAW